MFVIAEPYYEGDTINLVSINIEAIRACLNEGRYSGCWAAGPLPLFQYVPAFILRVLGFSTGSVLHFLAYLNFLSFAGSVLLMFFTLNKSGSPALAVTAVLILITGPLLWYSHSTYGEMTATFLILAFTSACLLRAPAWLIALLFVSAGSTKEVAFPFLLVIGLVCLLPEVIDRPREFRGRFFGLIAGTVLTIVLNSAFNYFRYASFYNVGYLEDIQIVPTWKLQLSFFMGLWFSPSGGLTFFWGSFVFLYFALIGSLLFQRSWTKRGDRKYPEKLLFYLPLTSVSLMLFLLTLGFSRWYAPFGWLAWGPRLMLPWIPALLLLLLHSYSALARAVLVALLKKTSLFALTSTALVLVSLPQFVILFAPFIMGDIFAPTPDCPRTPVIQEDMPYYYHCLKTLVWPKKLALLEAFPAAGKPTVLLFSICYCVTMVGCCKWIGKELLQTRLNERV